MRRSLRWAWNALTALSLLLCVALVALWWRSAWGADIFWAARRGGTMWKLRSAAGAWSLTAARPWPADVPPLWARETATPPGGGLTAAEAGPVIVIDIAPSTVQWEWLVFAGGRTDRLRTLVRADGRPVTRAEPGAADLLPIEDPKEPGVRWSAPMPAWWVAGPWWVPTAAFAVPPLAWLAMRGRRAWVRRRRRLSNRCPACGYDLRATPGRCPECGAAAAR